ncbi:flagellar biosynthesis protein FlhB [Hydrogenophaga sp.]|uniref:flagellar biosynthesis protein FlhB n=1 Tax=Hydrogenophaga sp. TaxID=1904254 RepID=UPI00286E6CA9|nr:flagellar biosynthesis protein FlhB [Hydrogenophaga sp.]
MSSSAQDKNLPATAQRMKKAREEGNIARSKDLGNLAVLGGGAVVLMALLPAGFEQLLTGLRQQLRFDLQTLSQPAMMAERLSGAAAQWMLLALPLGLLVLAIALGVAFASGGWALSTKPLMPDLNRINPLSGIGRLFSKQQLVETLKLVFMTGIVGLVGWQFLSGHFQAFGSLLVQPLEGGLGQLGQWLMAGVGVLLLVVTVFAMIDFPIQKFLHAQRLKMSLEEVKREHKESEGDPHMRGRRRQRQRELAQRNSVSAVPRADLVVMNPTHYAVALKYDDATMAAPRVIAKGADLVALKIRDVAKASDVPVLQSPMLARALYAHTEIDGEIPSALYTAVAQVLAYVYQVKAALAGRGAMPGQMPTPEVPPELDPHWTPPATAA